ncbi:MAG: TRAP transporter small permease [Planctomycetes bacterium]|nr:TRAP transporter small permease [Planctomycetota bacterium]MCD7896666.1 TRAP transporter small permease [Planctomycetaceae bacterium]
MFSRWIDYVCGAICVLCVAAMVVLTGAQIVCREFFTALHWSEELIRYLLVWATFLGAGSVYRRSGHISVGVVQDLVPPHLRTVMRILCHLLCGAFFVAVTIYGLDYAAMQSRQLSAALRIPMSRVYLAIPIGCAIMAIHVVDRLFALITERTERKEAAA